jgi:hypothetical protein
MEGITLGTGMEDLQMFYLKERPCVISFNLINYRRQYALKFVDGEGQTWMALGHFVIKDQDGNEIDTVMTFTKH